MLVATIGSKGSDDGEFLGSGDLALDRAGNLYVTDLGNFRVQKFSPTGDFLSKWGSKGIGNNQFLGGTAVATGGLGSVYVIGTSTLQVFDSNGRYLNRWPRLGAAGGSPFDRARGIAADGIGNIHVVLDTMYSAGNRLITFRFDPISVQEWGKLGTEDGQFHEASAIAVDSSGNVYVADSALFRIQKFNRDRAFLNKWGSQGDEDGEFQGMGAIAVDDSDNLYVADVLDYYRRRIQKFSPDGEFLGRWDHRNSGDTHDLQLGSMAVKDQEHVYISDGQNVKVFSLVP